MVVLTHAAFVMSRTDPATTNWWQAAPIKPPPYVGSDGSGFSVFLMQRPASTGPLDSLQAACVARVTVMLPVPRDRVVFRTPLPESVKGAQKVGLGVCDAPLYWH